MKDKFSKFSLPLLWFFATIVIIFMMTLTVNAQGLPIIVTNENTPSFDDFNYILKRTKNIDMLNCADGSFGYTFTEAGEYKYCFYLNEGVLDYEFTLSNDYDDFDITQDRIDMHVINIYRRLIWRYDSSGSFYGSDIWTADFHINFGSGTSNGSGGPLIPQISNKDFLYDDNQYQVVFGFGNPTPPYTGHATAPEEYDSPVYPTGHAKPNQVPTAPIINNYSWTNYTNPPIDTTNLESLVDSLIDIVIYNFSYLFTNLAGLFSNLISNISDFIGYLGQLIEYYGNLIISNIQNAITTFYNNMVSLFDPVLDGLSYLVEPVDFAEVNSAFNNTSFVGLKSQFSTLFTTFENAFDISEPNTFILTINIQNIDTFYNFGCRSPVIIHLDEHFIPIRTALRTFLWVFISFGTVFVVERGLSDWLRGENDTK